MIELRTIEGASLSLAIKDLSPITKEGQVVKNRLIDGTYHVQTIGSPSEYVEFEILSNEDQVDEINAAEALGNTVEIEIDGVVRVALIDSQPTWSRFSMRHRTAEERLYTAKVKLNLAAEG